MNGLCITQQEVKAFLLNKQAAPEAKKILFPLTI